MTEVHGSNVQIVEPHKFVVPDVARNLIVEAQLRAQVEAVGLSAYISGRHTAEHHEDDAGEPFICTIESKDAMEHSIIYAASWRHLEGTVEVGRLRR